MLQRQCFFGKLPGSSFQSRVLWTSSVTAALGNQNGSWIKSEKNRNSVGFLWGAAFLRQRLGCTVLSWGWINHFFLHTESLNVMKWLIPSVFHFPSFSSHAFPNTEVFILSIYLSIIYMCVYLYLKNITGFTLKSARGKPVLWFCQRLLGLPWSWLLQSNARW